MQRFIVVLSCLTLSFSFIAQEQALIPKPILWKGHKKTVSDTSSLLAAFKNGHFDGRIRLYSAGSINQDSLTDYYANAAGIGLRYETGKFKGFQLAAGSFFTYNIASSDFSQIDPSTNTINRYELGLFDVENPSNTKNLAQNEELYIKYSSKKFAALFGRQFIHTPLINLQDGRMRGTTVEGLWLAAKPIKSLKLEGGWLYRIYPRSTNRWFDIGESMGLYPQGRSPLGGPANYLNNIRSAGIGVFSATYKPTKTAKMEVWNYFVENVSNSVFVQAEDARKIGESNHHILYGAQYLRQDALNYGGNQNQALSYMLQGEQANAFGGMVGWKNEKFQVDFNYTRITGDGRFMFPREWGRDPFYTFLPRERNEGYGNVHAVSTNFRYKPKEKPFVGWFGVGYYQLPDIIAEAPLNKYAIPSYVQTNIDLKYVHSGWLNGLESHLLVVSKIATGNTYDNPNFVFQKVNMVHVNLIFNYYF
jgi:hypothetical protein